MTETKVLLFDIECSLASGYFYGLYDQNISIANIIEHPRMIAFTAKWLGKRKIYAFSEYHDTRKGMLEELWKLLDEAHVVAGWNSRNFDVKWVQSEFMVEKMQPPSPYKQVDLMQETKRNARFISNKLSYVSQRLLDDDKLDYNMASMWIKVNNPETTEDERKKEWNAMLRYAKKDTALLEPLFKELRPWIKMPHPINPGDPDSCHNCGGRLRTNGFAPTLNGQYTRLRCVECGKSHRGTSRMNVTNVRAEA